MCGQMTDGQSSYGQLLVYCKEVMFGVPGIIGPPMIYQYEPKNHRLSLKNIYFSWQSPYFDIQGHIGGPKVTLRGA